MASSVKWEEIDCGKDWTSVIDEFDFYARGLIVFVVIITNKDWKKMTHKRQNTAMKTLFPTTIHVTKSRELNLVVTF